MSLYTFTDKALDDNVSELTLVNEHTESKNLLANTNIINSSIKLFLFDKGSSSSNLQD